jgi:transposase-like protein
VLGLWIVKNEGTKFWAGVLNEIWNRGEEDILKAIYTASCEEAGRAALDAFGGRWNEKYPMIAQAWATHSTSSPSSSVMSGSRSYKKLFTQNY